MELVKKEMGWTVSSFEYKERLWKEMAEGAKRGGHRAYGWKQSWMWGKRARIAAATFESLKGV